MNTLDDTNMGDITTPIMITDNESLHQLCVRWESLPYLALDTEFIRINTFFPKLGLLQVCDNHCSYLLDPLRISDWTPFIKILEAESIVKLLHSCSEDLAVFHEFFGTVPGPIFDTQRAAAFLNLGFSLSYQNLVKLLLQIDVPKGETRSDWLRRPLSQEQLAYAALDVAWLPRVYQLLLSQLQEKGRLQWLLADCEQMRLVSRAAAVEADWDDYYLSLGAAWRLNAEQLGVLRELCRWREVEARRRNKPRSWIARDAEFITIATAMPADMKALRTLTELPGALLNHDGAVLITLISAGRLRPAPGDPLSKPLTSELRKSLKQCQAAVGRVAAEMEIAEELLARKKQLVGLLINYHEQGTISWPEDLSGWRRDALELELSKTLTD
jgi:ribonuclease D